MMTGKVVISGPDDRLKDEIADHIFALTKERKIPAICLDPYIPHPERSDHIVGDALVICIVRGKMP
jgi:hypothetical protein